MINIAVLYKDLIIIELFLAVIVFVVLNFISAPYGRFGRKGWGPSVKSRYSWIVMEMPALVIPVVLFLLSVPSVISFIFLLIWLSHYFHRTLIYPFRIYNSPKSFSLLVIIWGFLFNIINSLMIFLPLFFIRHIDLFQWIRSWPFITGILIFITGYIINKKSDAVLNNLKRKNNKKYSIPYGGLYRWISSPNYLGEIIEWAGWALLTWSLSGSVFFIFTIANLFPRAIMNHKWYKNNFREYPQNRKALLPFIC